MNPASHHAAQIWLRAWTAGP
uniref:Uncharacterized protein n=1 Tax=Arundo donax TaxID=35708 RepID=A0A0A9A4U5_ARUDO